MENKIVGSINLLLGIFYITLGVIIHFFVLPKISEIYSQFEVQLTTLQSLSRMGFLALFIVAGLINLYFGIRLFSNNKKSKEKDLVYGIIAMIGGFMIIGISVFSIVMPIYSLTESF